MAEQSTSLTQGLNYEKDFDIMTPSNLMIGNGLMNYDFNAGNGNPAYDLFVDKLDGLLLVLLS